jgi:hypothetical protein
LNELSELRRLKDSVNFCRLALKNMRLDAEKLADALDRIGAGPTVDATQGLYESRECARTALAEYRSKYPKEVLSEV